MKEKVPDIFEESFTNGFGIPAPETETDQIAGDINREFISRKLRWLEWINNMNAG